MLISHDIYYFLLIFYATFRQIEIFVKTFREKFSQKIHEISQKKRDTFRKSFRFRERSKKCFRPNRRVECVRFVEKLVMYGGNNTISKTSTPDFSRQVLAEEYV
jgi:hypothetical protein